MYVSPEHQPSSLALKSGAPSSSQEDDTPPVFHQLDSFTPSRYRMLEDGDHLFGIFGDNFFRSTAVVLRATKCHPRVVGTLEEKERALATKKKELADFEYEYQEALEAFKKASTRLEKETATVDTLLKERSELYNAYAFGGGDAAAKGEPSAKRAAPAKTAAAAASAAPPPDRAAPPGMTEGEDVD